MIVKKASGFNFFIKLTIVAVICFCAVNIIRQQSEINSKKNEYYDYSAIKAEYDNEIDRLKEELEAEMDDQYIMRIAREKLNYYLPEEIIFYTNH